MREETILNAINDLDSISCMIQDIHESIYQDSPDYWDKLLHQYAGMAMQALIIDASYADNEGSKYLVEECTAIAHALVEMMKEVRK